MTNLDDKLLKLRESIAAYGHMAVAFSGGVDSTLLLAVAHEVLGNNAFAVTAVSAFAPQSDISLAQDFCDKHDIRWVGVDVDPLSNEAIKANAPDRCYFCKRMIFEQLIDAVRKVCAGKVDVLDDVASEGSMLADGASKSESAVVLADGTNADDANTSRPGLRALSELNVVSPLRDAALTKSDVRELSRRMNLPTANAPSAACLATRVPYGTPLDASELARIDAAEDFLHGLDFGDVRVRSHGSIARIEVYPLQLPRLVDPETRRLVASKMHELGWSYVTADIEGFRSGSMDEAQH